MREQYGGGRSERKSDWWMRAAYKAALRLNLAAQTEIVYRHYQELNMVLQSNNKVSFFHQSGQYLLIKIFFLIF
jgi:hypothetical protein